MIRNSNDSRKIILSLTPDNVTVITKMPLSVELIDIQYFVKKIAYILRHVDYKNVQMQIKEGTSFIPEWTFFDAISKQNKVVVYLMVDNRIYCLWKRSTNEWCLIKNRHRFSNFTYRKTIAEKDRYGYKPF